MQDKKQIAYHALKDIKEKFTELWAKIFHLKMLAIDHGLLDIIEETAKIEETIYQAYERIIRLKNIYGEGIVEQEE